MSAPLADRLRPQALDEIVGQKHLLGEGKPLRNIILSGELPNLVFYGPSGVGKTTLAGIIARTTNRRLHRLNGTTASTADIRDVVAELDTFAAPNGILLYLDEIQYFNKKQQQSLLEYIENGKITLIASTTENPYFYIYNAILSRSTVFEFKVVEPAEIERAVQRAFIYLEEERGERIVPEEGVIPYIAQACGGDVRKSINAVELCVLASPMPAPGEARVITLAHAKELSQRSALRYDRAGDEHYDILSAFQKSMRGSDPDAAVYYLAKMLYAGEDVKFIARRMMILASEDIGNADPQALVVATAAAQAVERVGMPESQIILSQAAAYMACAPKSNAAVNAIFAAMDSVKRTRTTVPAHLQDAHYGGHEKLGHGMGYKYAHDYPNHYVDQQYLPDGLENEKFYNPGDLGYEKEIKSYFDMIKNNKNS